MTRFISSIVCCLILAPSIRSQETAPSALEKDPDGWIDLMPANNLAGWKRVPLDEKLSERNPWSIDGKLLLCDGVGIKEMFLHDKQFADGIFHVEWRFRPVTTDKKDYNSGVYIRSPADGKVWLQVQVAHNDKPPFMGDIFGGYVKDDKLEKVLVRGEGVKRINPPGKWNTYEITAKGKNVSVWINGATTLTWNDCQAPRGHIGLQAEFFFIEFRNLKFKELK